MASGRVITINRQMRRPEPAQYAALAGLPTSNVSDLMERRGALPARIRPVSRTTHFVGPALTVRCRPADSLATLVALAHVRDGDIMVIATDAHEGAAVIGGHFVAMAHQRGVAAIVTDGMTRDAEELVASPIPIFTGGVTPAGSYKDGPGEVGCQISLGQTVIRNGDILIGDADGVIVVPQYRLAAVCTAASAIRAREQQNAVSIDNGTMPAWLAAFVAGTAIIEIDVEP